MKILKSSVIIILALITTFWIDFATVQKENLQDNKPKKKSTNKKVEKVENIAKPPNDHRLYRGLKLSNGMKVLLISDPSTKRSVASMVVGVGSLNDPRDVPGLASLVGFLMIRASKKYPEPYNFQKFVESREGRAPKTIITTSEQYFGFFINPNSLAQGLEKFAYLFIKPRWLDVYDPHELASGLIFAQETFEECSSRNLYHIVQVERTISKKNHAFKYCFEGNQESLYHHTSEVPISTKDDVVVDLRLISLYNKAKKFYSTWYSSSITTLAVLGRESLDRLEEMVVPLFKHVKHNTKAMKISYTYDHRPWGPEQMKNKLFIVPISDLKVLRLTFPVPDVRDQYKTAPDEFFTDLLCNEGPSGVSSELRKNDLCTKFYHTRESDLSGISFFVLLCDLTDRGEENIDEIIYIIFQYIYLIKREGVQKSVFEELASLKQITFLNQRSKTEDSLNELELLASALHIYPVEDILTFGYFRDHWDSSLIHKFLCHIRPENMNVTIVGQKYRDIADSTEKYFKTPYKVEPISDILIKKWKSEDLNLSMKLLFSNKFLPKSFELYPIDETEPKYPYILHQSPVSEIWFKQDSEFGIPVLQVDIEIFCPTMLLSPMHLSLWHLFNVIVSNFFIECLHKEGVTGSAYKFGMKLNDRGSLFVKIFGYSDKLPILLEEILSRIMAFTENKIVDKTLFIESLIRYISIVEDESTRSHLFQLDWDMQLLQNQSGWTQDTFLNALKMLQYNDMKKFLQKMFHRIFLRALIHGNCTKKKAMEMVNIVEKQFFQSRQLLSQELLLIPRYVELPAGSQFIFDVFNTTPQEYGYASYFQSISESTSLEDVKIYLLHEIILESYKTNKQLKQAQSEIISLDCTVYQIYHLKGLLITVQAKRDPVNIDKRVETFLRSVFEVLSNPSGADFESFKKSLEMKLYTRPSDLTSLSERYWSEISNRNYGFDESEELKYLKSLKRTDILEVFRKILDMSSSKRRLLSIFVLPKDSGPDTYNQKTVLRGVIKIKEIDVFKNYSTLLPFYYNEVP